MPISDTSERHREEGAVWGGYVVSLSCGFGAAGHGGLGTWKRASQGEAFPGGCFVELSRGGWLTEFPTDVTAE